MSAAESQDGTVRDHTAPTAHRGGATVGVGSAPSRREQILLLVLGLLLFLPGLGSRDLWNPDEPRYAEVGREMVLTGDYLVPHLNGDLYTQKPPLMFWSMAAASGVVGGMSAWAARLPAALAAVGALLLILRLGHLWFGRRAAWLAVAAFATCGKVLWTGHVGQIDMLLTFLVLAAVSCWAWSWSAGRRELSWGFFAFAGLATLAKGPVGLLPPLLSIVIFLLITRQYRALGQLRVGRGLLVWAAVVLAWAVPAVLAGGERYFDELIFKQNVTRYVNPWHHFRPWYYYLRVLPLDFLPWSLLLPGALWAGWRRLRDARWRPFLFCLVWVAVTLVFFSVSPGKRTVYILTMYPGLCLALGAGLDALAELCRERFRPRLWLAVPLGFLALLFGAAAAWIPSGVAEEDVVAVLGPDLPMRLVGAVSLIALGAAIGMVLSLRGQSRQGVAALAAGMAVAAVGIFATVLPRVDMVKSARPLSETLVALEAEDEPYALYPRRDPTYLFYTGRIADLPEDEEELREFVARPERVWVLAERDDLEPLDPPLAAFEIARDNDLEEGYVLLTNLPLEDPAAARRRIEERLRQELPQRYFQGAGEPVNLSVGVLASEAKL